MKCECASKHLGAYVDGELEASLLVEFDEHLEACAPCRELLEFEVVSRDWIKTSLQATAPSGLAAKVQAGLDREEEPDISLSWRMVPAAAAAAALIFGGASWYSHLQAGDAAALEDVVRVHASGLPSDVDLAHLPENAEAREEVSEWFRGKVGFPVRAAQFSAPDVRLVGARLSNVRERQAAALFYDLQGHRVTVVVTDASVVEDDGEELQVGSRRIRYRELQGHRVPVRVEAGLSYAFTGDVDQQTLLRLAASARVP